MPNKNQNQIQNPEMPGENVEGNGEKVVQTPENAMMPTVVPQPATNPKKDDAAAKKIEDDLQSSPQAPAANVNPSPAPAQTQPQARKVPNKDPYIKAAENVIEADKNDPYKEEEDHEDVQIQYLRDRFGKDIKKSENN